MKSGASDPFGDSEDDEDERSESSTGRAAEPRDERSEPPESRTESEANREREESAPSTESSGETDRRDAEADSTGEGGTGSAVGSDAAEGDGPLSRDELPFVLRRDRVKDERPEVHQLFVQQETHDRAVDAERALEDRMDVDLSRTDAREAIYLAGMAHLDDAEDILRNWGYDL